MRPDPDDHSSGSDPARIIYLGEVRRRRASRSTAPARQYLAVLGLIALVSWALWLSVLLALQPARLLTYLAFFIPLWVALASTLTIALYTFEWRRGLLARLSRCGARSAVLATVLVVNLALQAAHRWSVIVAGATLLLAAGVETVLEQRRRSRP